MKQRIKRVLAKRPHRKKRAPESTLEQAIRGIPRITNETVAEHREAVLSSARKYIYPLKHSAHRVVVVSASLIIVVIVAFFSFCMLELYKFHSTSTFMYRVTQVIPFPVAKAGSSYVSYENYLFELRHYIHYYQTQQKVDFSSESGKQQLTDYSKRALDTVIGGAYAKQLAKQSKISVSTQEVNDQITTIRAQNRLGDNQKVFADVLKEFWGWSIDDFRRELSQQILNQKVVTKLDTQTNQRAQDVLAQLQNGADFGQLAAKYSDDKSTAANNGDYGIDITQTTREIPPAVVAQLFKMQAGQTSGIINAGSSLEILRVKDNNGTVVHASHIGFEFKNIDAFTAPLEAKSKPHKFISL